MNDYKLSFTSNSLNIEESIKIAEIYNEHGKNWVKTKSAVLSHNLLQRKKEQTIIREFREIKHRITNLTTEQFNLLLTPDLETQRLTLLLAVCKTYPFIKEFIIEVVRNKYIQFQTIIYDADYENFLLAKSAVHEKLNQIKDSTKEKIRRVLFTILSQAGIINSVSDRMILQPLLLPPLIECIVHEDPNLLKIYLVSDTDLLNYTKKYGNQ